MNTVSVILPTYNEKDNIIPLIGAIRSSVAGLKEILVVDDNSPDQTAVSVSGWIKKHPNGNVRLILRTSNQGLTNSIREGIRRAKGNIIVWMDADFSMPPDDINRLTAMISQGADIAVGSRFVPGGKTKQPGDPHERWYAILASEIGNFFMPRLFGLNFHDYTSGFVAVRKNIATTIPLHGDYGEYFIDFIVRAFSRGYRVVEVPYVCKPRARGITKTAHDFPSLLKRLVQYGVMIGSLLWKIKINRENL